MSRNPARKIRRAHQPSTSRRHQPKSLLDTVVRRAVDGLKPAAPVWAPPAPSVVHRWCVPCGGWHGPTDSC